MISQAIDLKDTGKFSQLFLDYLDGHDQLQPFSGLRPDISSLRKQIESVKISANAREILADTLQQQYAMLPEVPDEVNKNISLLRKNTTFTITTGHQLNLCTGPLYVIYKLVTIIRACQELKKVYPDYDFVPLYWMASEDHDFEEIDHFHFNGNTYRWNSDQQGPVGRFELKDMKPLLDELSAIPAFFHTAYSGKWTLADAVRSYMNDLFGRYGLVVLDPDNHDQKELFREVMTADIFDHAFREPVESVSNTIEALGYSTQIKAREINFFYIENQLRSRIEEQNGRFVVVDSPIEFTKAEMADLIDKRPECLSPNVVLRPLYQETILPNLAYIGGPSELVYWLQLKGVFDKAGTPFPVLMPRNFAMIIPSAIERKRQKTSLELPHYFNGKDALLKDAVTEQSDNELTLNEQVQELDVLFDKIIAKARAIDETLIANVDAQRARSQKSIQEIEKKFIRAEKRNQEFLTRQIEEVYETLFPGSGLQERHDNFLNFYQTDPAFIDQLMAHLDPFDFRFNILTYGE